MQRIKQLEIIPSVRPEVTLVNKVFIADLINPENGKKSGFVERIVEAKRHYNIRNRFPISFNKSSHSMYFLSTGLPLDTAASKTINNTAQKLTVLDALKSFTVWSAYACFDEENKGTIEPGKLADMVVLSEDIITADPKALLTARILKTIVRGEIVFENKSPAAYIR